MCKKSSVRLKKYPDWFIRRSLITSISGLVYQEVHNHANIRIGLLGGSQSRQYPDWFIRRFPITSISGLVRQEVPYYISFQNIYQEVPYHNNIRISLSGGSLLHPFQDWFSRRFHITSIFYSPVLSNKKQNLHIFCKIVMNKSAQCINK